MTAGAADAVTGFRHLARRNVTEVGDGGSGLDQAALEGLADRLNAILRADFGVNVG